MGNLRVLENVTELLEKPNLISHFIYLLENILTYSNYGHVSELLHWVPKLGKFGKFGEIKCSSHLYSSSDFFGSGTQDTLSLTNFFTKEILLHEHIHQRNLT